MTKKRYDKPAMSVNVAEFAAANFPDPNRKILFTGVGGESSEVGKENFDLARVTDHWDKTEQLIKDYNSNINVLDEDYKSITPVHIAVVRAYHIEATRTKSGLIIAPKIPMKEMTQNGIGIRQTIDSPWAFSRKCVVVAVPEHVTHIKAGDIVEINRRCVLAEKPSVDTPAHLAHGFTLSDWYDFEAPTDISNKHFGYLAVDPINDVTLIIKKS